MKNQPKIKLLRHDCRVAATVLQFVCDVIDIRESAHMRNTLTRRELHSLRVFFGAEAEKVKAKVL